MQVNSCAYFGFIESIFTHNGCTDVCQKISALLFSILTCQNRSIYFEASHGINYRKLHKLMTYKNIFFLNRSDRN